MRLTFRPTLPLDEYHGNGIDLKPGDSAEVADALGTRLLRDFPENFFPAVEARTSKAADLAAPPVDRQIKQPWRRKGAHAPKEDR